MRDSTGTGQSRKGEAGLQRRVIQNEEPGGSKALGGFPGVRAYGRWFGTRNGGVGATTGIWGGSGTTLSCVHSEKKLREKRTKPGPKKKR